MKKLLLSIFILFFTTPIFSQEVNIPLKTSTESGRFEFIQSTISRKISLMLDKYTGKVWQMVRDSEYDCLTFEYIPKTTQSTDVKSAKINYQLFLGGMMLSDCFLLNINTGEVWQLVKDKDDYNIFELLHPRLDSTK